MIILYFQAAFTQNPTSISTTELTLMNVVAPSGLKMRAQPTMDSEVLYVIPTRSAVVMMNTEMIPPVQDEVGYMKGSWVYVGYEGEEGYVFDGFLSSLPLPINEFEMTQFDLDLIYPLETYMDYHKLSPINSDTFSSDLYSKVIHEYSDGSKMIQKHTLTQYHLKVVLPETTIWEAYHLLVQMLSTRSETNSFLDAAMFIANREGLVDKIKIDLADPISITKTPQGDVMIEIVSQDQACTVDLTKS